MAHPGAVTVPRTVTGGAMEDWHCSGTTPLLSPDGETLDERGFVERIWKPLN